MRNMSFALTVPQIMAGTKTQTRRLGWKTLNRGDELQAVVKSQGLKKCERVENLRVIRVTYIFRERLNCLLRETRMEPGIGRRDVDREGFPDMTPQQFVAFFCATHTGCTPEMEVTVIGFEYVAAVGDLVETSALVSGRPWTGRIEGIDPKNGECKVVPLDGGNPAYLHQTALAGFKVLPQAEAVFG